MGLTMRQIKSAIESQIEVSFPGVTVHKTGVMKSFARPSFYVMILSPNSDDHLYNKKRSISVDIHYFPTERYQHTLELLDVQDTLDTVFGLNLTIVNRVVTLNSQPSDVADGVLHYPFEFEYWEDQPQSTTGNLMEVLDYNG